MHALDNPLPNLTAARRALSSSSSLIERGRIRSDQICLPLSGRRAALGLGRKPMSASANEFVLSAIGAWSASIVPVLIALICARPINAASDRTMFRRLSGAPQAVR
jgi:hypothetical protein